MFKNDGKRRVLEKYAACDWAVLKMDDDGDGLVLRDTRQ